MIDLGGELAHYGDRHPAPPAATGLPGFVRERPGVGVTVPLADLQAQGFNRTPPPGYRLHRAVASIAKDVERLMGWPDPWATCLLPAVTWDLPDTPDWPTP